MRPGLAATADEVINAYERLRAAALGAEPIGGSGLATMRHEGMAAWLKAAPTPAALPTSMPAVPRPPATAGIARNELTLLLASLVVTLSAEATSV